VIEQITYLIFLRMADVEESKNEALERRTGTPFNRRFGPDEQGIRWSRLKELGSSEEMVRRIRDEAFPHIRAMGGFMADAQFMIPKASLLKTAIDTIDTLPLTGGDDKGDIYEYLLSKLTTAGINGQFRTPRHIIRFMAEAIDMRQYEAEVNSALRGLFDSDPALKRLRAGEPIAPADLDRLAKLVLVQNPSVDMAVLKEFYPDAEALSAFFRQAVGVDPEALRTRFAEFAAVHPALTGTQRRFLQMLETHIARHGAISVAQLYEPPFTGIDTAGIEGVFPDATADEVVALVQPFAPATAARNTLKDIQ
jgi:hypothetical protein